MMHQIHVLHSWLRLPPQLRRKMDQRRRLHVHEGLQGQMTMQFNILRRRVDESDLRPLAHKCNIGQC